MIGAIPRRVTVGDGVELATWTWAGSTPSFLLVHGLASNARLWDGVAGYLHQNGYCVVSVDLRGHGLSDRPDDGFDFATISRDLAVVVDQTGTGPVIAAGQSWGANVVLELAARHQDLVSSVVCLDGGFIELAARFASWEETVEALTPPELPALSLEEMAAHAPLRFPDFPPSGIAAQMANLEEVNGRAQRRLPLSSHLMILRHLYNHRPLATASGLSQPVLIVAASNGLGGNEAERAGALTRTVPRARLRWLNGQHDLHAQHPQAVAAEVLAALDDGFLR
jgi:pimeloyl-ACP methyl ester carboxylesterase